MTDYKVEFETSLPEADVARWFQNNITHEHDDFVLRYIRYGLYATRVDGVIDRDLIVDNPDFQVLASHVAEEELTAA